MAETSVNVAHYISELLFRHDCVVVPGLGGFVCSHTSARVNPVNHTFSPPGKQVVLNRHLQQNDGLLAQEISSAAACSFDEAMKRIGEFVNEIQVQLKAGKKTEIANLGTLSLDEKNNLGFEASPEINFLIDSFGLSSFQSLPVVREFAAEKRKPVERVDRPAEERKEKVTPQPRRSPVRRLVITGAIVLPLVAAAIWFPFPNGNGLAGLGLFGKKEISKYSPAKIEIPKLPQTFSAKPLSPDSNGIAALSYTDKSDPIIVDIHKAEADSTFVAQPHASFHSASDHYFVIAGCFRVPENAENFRRMLQQKGYHPEFLNGVHSDLMHIGIASFPTKKEAEVFLASVRSEVPDAWILRK